MSEAGIAKIMLKTEENIGNILCYKNNVVYLQNKADKQGNRGVDAFYIYISYLCFSLRVFQ